MSALEPDAAAIGQFVNALFRYADNGSFVSLRTFPQSNREDPPTAIVGVRLNGAGHEPLIAEAVKQARFAANTSEPSVFAPPCATFLHGNRASEDQLVDGLEIAVDLDHGDIGAARARLEQLLGPATIVTASGSQCTDEATGEVVARVHMHWRLSEPTTTPAEHAKLKHARRLAHSLAFADPTGATAVHPFRWPGSWNLKDPANPKLSTIVAGNDDAEVHLSDAIDALEEAADAAGLKEISSRKTNGTSGDPQSDPGLLASAMAAIPNDDEHWDAWNRYGMAMWRATGGGQAGLDAWSDWSAKSGKHNVGECDARWAQYSKSPPTRLGAGTVYFEAKLAGWQRPKDQREQGPPEAEPEAKADAPAERGELHGRLRVYGVADINTAAPRDYLLKGIMSPGEISLWVGAPKCGKSFLMLYISYMLSLGRPIFGRRVKPTSVLYVAAEGEAGIAARIRVLRDRHGPSPDFHFIAQPADLLHHDGHLNDLIAAIRHYKAGLVPLDTLSRLFAGGEENSSADMGCFVRNLTAARFQTSTHLAVIHHGTQAQPGKPRGHSSLPGADDALIEVEKDATTGFRKATLIHAKDDPDGVVLPFLLAPVSLGTDSDGDEMQTLIAEETEPRVSPDSIHLNDSEKLAMRAFDAAVSKHVSPDADCYAIDVSQWRDEFYAMCEPGQSPEAKQTAFRRAVKSLLAKDVIGTRNDLVWRLGS